MAFDLRSEIKDPKTGKVTSYQPYALHISAAEGTLYERPIGSGFMYYASGELAKKPSDEVIAAREAATRPKLKVGSREFSSQAEVDAYVLQLESLANQEKSPEQEAAKEPEHSPLGPSPKVFAGSKGDASHKRA